MRDELRRDYPIIDVDGVRVKFEDGWGLVRASNTQPVLVLRFEASTEKQLQDIRRLIEAKVRSAISALQETPSCDLSEGWKKS